jgi:Protein of unknown function (DUF1571)
MRCHRNRVLWALGLGVCLSVCGCVVLGQPPTILDQQSVPTRPRSSQFTETVADLRITAAEVPADPVPASSDIPLVRVPPPPLQGDRPRPAPLPTPAPTTTIAVPTTTTPPAAAPALPPMQTPEELYQQARAEFGRFDSYIARLARREPGKGKKGEQILAFSFRKEPWSIRFKWLAGEGLGREVLYVKNRYENKIHTLLAAGDMPLVPAGRRISMAVDSPLVLAANRHPITDAGIGAMIDRFGQVLEANSRGDFRKGKLTSLGLQQRPDYDTPLYMVEQTVPAGADFDVPHGGRRLIGFSPETHLLVLSVLYDNKDKEIDYARFDRLMLGLNLGDDDFDPEQMGKRADTIPENAVQR